MTLGFEQAGFDVLAAVELDPIHACTHEYNFPFWTVLCRNIVDITGEEIRKLSPIGDRDIDVVFGGPPCQGFSLMGKRHPDDPRNSLIFHFLRLVLELQPKFFVMENVRGMTVGRQRQFLEKILREFKEHNYRVVENYQILNAANYAIPQNRHRLFLLGCRQDLLLPSYPQPLTTVPSKGGHQLTVGAFNISEECVPEESVATPVHQLRSVQAPPSKGGDSSLPIINDRELNLLPTPTVGDAIADLPEVNNYPELEVRDWVFAESSKPSEYVNQLHNPSSKAVVSPDYSYPRIYDPKLLTCSRRTKHSQETIARFAATSPGKIERISHFYRLDLNGLCSTLRAGTARNRGAFTSPRPIHPVTPRCITVREAARLHSYPDWFRFHGTKWHGFRQIGNSVPPLLAKAVAREIINCLSIEPSKPTQKYLLGQEQLLQFTMYRAAQYYQVEENAIAPRCRNK
jgi:DNA (cytosine-5)-methyltransferase 1